MKIVGFNIIYNFYLDHPDTEASLLVWHTLLKYQDLKSPKEVISFFGAENVEINKYHRVSVEVKSIDVVVIMSMNYIKNTATLKWIGWNRDFEKLDKLVNTINAL